MDPDKRSDQERGGRWQRATELTAAVLLSFAALASSYAGFEADLWDGEQAANYALAEESRTSSAKDATIGAQYTGIDTILFTQWLDAYASNDRALAKFYELRFRPEFRTVFDQWIALGPRINSDVPSTPFHMPAYRNGMASSGGVSGRKADELFAKGQRANEISDTYGQAVLILALSLFLGGVVQGFSVLRTRILLLSFSAFCFVIGLARIAFLPAIHLL
jgi:hypothetical protein